jgi:hypothetical protein
VNKCLEKDRNLRYQHASEIRADLQRLKRDSSVGGVHNGAQSPAPSALPPSRKWLPTAIALAALLVLLAAVYFYFPRTIKQADLSAAGKLTDTGKPANREIVLADFTNTTGDPALDRALRQGLRSNFKNRKC